MTTVSRNSGNATKRERLQAIVQKTGIAFVGEQHDAAIMTKRSDANELLVVDDRAARIVGGIGDQQDASSE